jgi:hypothetical protein
VKGERLVMSLATIRETFAALHVEMGRVPPDDAFAKRLGVDREQARQLAISLGLPRNKPGRPRGTGRPKIKRVRPCDAYSALVAAVDRAVERGAMNLSTEAAVALKRIRKWAA